MAREVFQSCLLPDRVSRAGSALKQCKVPTLGKSSVFPPLSRSWTAPICQQPTPVLHPVLAYIVGEMQKNAASGAVQDIHDINVLAARLFLLGPLGLAAAEIEKARAYDKWKDLVNEGHVWDHKSYIKKTWTAYQTIDFKTIGKAEKIEFFLDIWSNIHYGYVGLAAAFTELELIQGSNIQSWLHNGSGDPLSDVVSIKIGFRLYHGTLSVPALLKEIYEHSHDLSGTPVK
jgi:hypothetical protein